MKLYSGPLSMFGAKAEIAALEKGLDVELIMVPFEMKTLYQPKHPEVLRINPKRQVPVLIDGELELFDSAQIFGERMGAPVTDAHPRLKAWRARMSARPAVRQVAGAMGRYLLSQGRKLPPFL